MQKNFIKKRIFSEIFRYYLISISSFIILLTLLYFFVEIMHIGQILSYFFAYLAVYIFDILTTFKFVFKSKLEIEKIIKYIVIVIFFFILNFLIYERLVNYVSLYYFYSATICVILFSILKFVVKKKYIFNKNT